MPAPIAVAKLTPLRYLEVNTKLRIQKEILEILLVYVLAEKDSMNIRSRLLQRPVK